MQERNRPAHAIMELLALESSKESLACASEQYQSGHLLKQVIYLIICIALFFSKKIHFVRFVFIENNENWKRITCPNDLDRKFADY